MNLERAEREGPRLNQLDQLFDRQLSIGAHISWIIIKDGIFLKVVDIKDLIREIGLHQNVYIKIYVTQNLTVEARRDVHVAVETFENPVWLAKSEDVVPPIQPVILFAYCPRGNPSKQVVVNLFLEFSVEYQEREVSLTYAS